MKRRDPGLWVVRVLMLGWVALWVLGAFRVLTDSPGALLDVLAALGLTVVIVLQVLMMRWMSPGFWSDVLGLPWRRSKDPKQPQACPVCGTVHDRDAYGGACGPGCGQAMGL